MPLVRTLLVALALALAPVALADTGDTGGAEIPEDTGETGLVEDTGEESSASGSSAAELAGEEGGHPECATAGGGVAALVVLVAAVGFRRED